MTDTERITQLEEMVEMLRRAVVKLNYRVFTKEIGEMSESVKGGIARELDVDWGEAR